MIVGLCVFLGAQPAFAQSAPRAAAPDESATETPKADATERPRLPPEHAKQLSLLYVVETALKSHPSIRRARVNLAGREAALAAAKGPFDPLVTSGIGHSHEASPVLPAFSMGLPDYESDSIDTTNLDLGASWLSQWGMSVSPTISIQRIHQRPGGSVDTSDPAYDFYRDGYEPYHRARANLTVTQALLRGAGTTGAASAIDAARLSRQAASHQVAHIAQRQVFAAISAYWHYLAMVRTVEKFREAEEGAKKLVEDTTELVRADERPAADLRQLEGNLANRTRAVQDAMNGEIQALHTLYEAMGLELSEGLPRVPGDDFPAPALPEVSEREAISRALTRRQDLEALRQEVGSTEVALEGAEKNAQPALDLSVSVGYNGAIDEDGAGAFFSAAGSRIPGANAGVGLSLELPVSNTARDAERAARRAERDGAQIALDDLDRRIGIDVVTALNDLRLSAAAVEASTRAAEQFQKALDNERNRLREGVGTVINVTFSQDQLIQAQRNQLLDQARYSIAAAHLQFQMGSLPDSQRETPRAVSQMIDAGESR